MKVILGGKFETAIIRASDQIERPDRNASTHDYYAAINRYVGPEYFHRAGSFAALSSQIMVPSVDWRSQFAEEKLGVTSLEGPNDAERSHIEYGARQAFTKTLLTNGLSLEAKRSISNLTFKHYPEADRGEMEARRDYYEAAAAELYLDRILRQLKEAGDTGAYLVVSEDDVRLIEEICNWTLENKPLLPFALPDLRGKLIEPTSFVDGLLNFTPPDIDSVVAVKADPAIRKYADRIGTLLSHAPTEEREAALVDALIDAHEKAQSSAKANKVFEIASWVVKPLHYVPGLDAALTIAEDVKDVVKALYDKDIADKEWRLVATKMTDIATTDFLNRKSNLRRKS